MRIPSKEPSCKMGSPQLMGINMAPPYYSFKNCAGMTYFIIWQSNILKCLHVCVRMCPPLFLINITWYTYVCMTFYFFTKYLLKDLFVSYCFLVFVFCIFCGNRGWYTYKYKIWLCSFFKICLLLFICEGDEIEL